MQVKETNFFSNRENMAFLAIRKQGTDMSEQYANRQDKGQLGRLQNIQASKMLAENALTSPGFWMNRP
jgi:hypothetical protein